ncbi:MAG: sugar phosphate isomerase/epimerase [SAR202 cluster bacterium]|nr:sugar phosphate isomerase/epimerase [SAR202 cluster bacterium]
MPQLKVGYFNNSADPAKVIARCNELGVRYVNLGVGGMPGYKEGRTLNVPAMRELIGKLNDAGIEVLAMSQKGHLKSFPPASEPDILLNPSKHRKEIDAALQVIRAQGDLGIRSQLQYINFPEPQDPAMDEAYWAGMISIFKELIAEAERAKVGIGNHGIWRCIPDGIREEAIKNGLTADGYRHYIEPKFNGPYLVRTVEHCRRLAEAVPSPYHGITMCTGMYIHGGDPLAEMPKWKGKIFFCQIRDLNAHWPHSREMFPGTGVLNFKAILTALKDAGYTGFLHPEHLGNPSYPGEDLELKATKLLKDWVKHVRGAA